MRSRLMTDEKKIIDLETRIAHQDLLLEELNQVVYKQQLQIDALETQMGVLVKRIQEEAASAREIGPANDKPPHY
jgi:SlyX protein